jgi:hypothetical protein
MQFVPNLRDVIVTRRSMWCYRLKKGHGMWNFTVVAGIELVAAFQRVGPCLCLWTDKQQRYSF